MNEDRVSDYEEVDLMDYLKVVWKWKWLIVLGTVICVIVAGAVTLNMPRIYEVSSSIEVGKVEGGFIEEMPVMSQKIKSISLKSKIAKELSIPLEEIEGEEFFKVSSEGDRECLVITTKIETDKPDQGVKILRIVNQIILEDHQKKIKENREELLAKIAINEKWIAIKEEKGKMLEKRLLNIQKEITSLQQIRDRISKEEVEKVDVVGMVAYFNDFQARLNSLYYTQSQIIDQIPSQIQSYRENIVTLQGRFKRIKETKVIDPSHSSYHPVKPKTKLNILISAVIGFMVFILLSFFLEYIQKYKKESE